jgi:hypothetical protein
MRDGKEIWDAALVGTKSGDSKSAKVMMVYAVAQILAQAESAVLQGDDVQAVQQLEAVRTYAERLIERLKPELKLVAA